MTPVTSAPLDLGRPIAGDVVELILDDHRRFEELLRQLRNSSSDRDAVRHALAALHVAHAEAEEKYVYPTLRKKRAIGEHEAHHGEEEHAESNRALLAVLVPKSTDTQAFDDAVEELATALNPPSDRGGADHPQPGAGGGLGGRPGAAGPGSPHRGQRPAGRRLWPDRERPAIVERDEKKGRSMRRVRTPSDGLSPEPVEARTSTSSARSPLSLSALLRSSHGAVGTLRGAEPPR